MIRRSVSHRLLASAVALLAMSAGAWSGGVARAAPGRRGDAAPAEEASETDQEGTSEGAPEPDAAAAADKYRRTHFVLEQAWAEGRLGKGGEPDFWQPVRGVRHVVLDPFDFYREVGRQDLADSYRTRSHVKTGLEVGGAAAALAGILLLGERNLSLSGGLFVGGSVAWIVGYVMSPHPVGASRAGALADEYNESLRSSLGLTTVSDDESDDEQIPPGVAAGYRRDALAVHFDLIVSNYGVQRIWSVRRGAKDQTIELERFFRLVGREDLRRAYEHRSAVRTAVLVGSLVCLVGGAAAAYLWLQAEVGGDGTSSGSPLLGYAAVGGLLGGTIGLVVGSKMDPSPVSEGDARELADEYNRAILRNLGVRVSRQDAAPRAPAAPRPRDAPRFGLFPLPHGAGAAVALAF